MSAVAVTSREALTRSTESRPAEEPVSLWFVELDDPRAHDSALQAALSPAERRRAARFVREIDRRRFAATRGALRRLVADRLGCAPGDVPIVLDDRGKPGLAGGELKLSVSRSGGVALLALSPEMEIGVDIESVRRGSDVEAIAARFFTAAERLEIEQVPEPERRRAAFQCWVRKEAYVKGTGDGIALPLFAEADVGIQGHRQVGDWTVQDVNVPQSFAAAVAGRSESSGRQASSWRPGMVREGEMRGGMEVVSKATNQGELSQWRPID